MRIHHLNCATFCPYGGQLMGRPQPGLGPARMTCHCLLIETEQGLVLVDTGLGTADVTDPRPRLSGFFVAMMRPRLDLAETALRQVMRRGFSPGDVRHIVVTHLDFDHVGGLGDFPQATVHVLGEEIAAARRRDGGKTGRGRYRPQQWTPEPSWQTYSPDGEPWFGFRSVRDLVGLPPEILMIPLPGHTYGHTGVAVRGADGWILHAGDAYFYRGEMDPDNPTCPAGLRAYQRMMEVDREARLANQQRLRDLVRVHGDEVKVLCSHDAVEFDAWVARSVREQQEPRIRLVHDSSQPL